MDFYRLTLNRNGVHLAAVWYPTLGAAHQAAKSFPKHDRPHVYIDLLDVESNKAGVLALLNCAGVNSEDARPTPLRSWELTDRGGLHELTDLGDVL